MKAGWRNVSTSMRLMPSSIWRANRLPTSAGSQQKNGCAAALAITQKLVGFNYASATPPPSVLDTSSGSATGYYGDIWATLSSLKTNRRTTQNLRINFAPARLPVVRRATGDPRSPAAYRCPPRAAGFWGKWFRQPPRLSTGGNARQYSARIHRRYGQRHPVAAG